MKLTGKCKKDFEKWYEDNYSDYDFCIQFKEDLGEIFVFEVFLTIPFSMQYGVYVDFFDSVDLPIDMRLSNITGKFEIYITYTFGAFTRHEARTEAIKQANKIYNEKHSD